MKRAELLHRGACATLVALIVLCVAWEMWLAPLRPHGSWLVLKALPLCFAVPGIWQQRAYTMQWASMLVLLYMAEAVVRATTEQGISRALAGIELGLSLILFASLLAYLAPLKRRARARRDS